MTSSAIGEQGATCWEAQAAAPPESVVYVGEAQLYDRFEQQMSDLVFIRDPAEDAPAPEEHKQQYSVQTAESRAGAET